MSKLDVRIVKLPPLRVASLYAFGPEPESAVWAKMNAWAGPRGYLDDLEHHRIFGFNNPNPSAGSPNYGYELWITVGPEVQPDGEVRIEEFPGGLYAVSRIPVVGDPYQTIPAAWEELHRWTEGSTYKFGTHQWLEENLRTPETPAGDWTMDIYLPIAE